MSFPRASRRSRIPDVRASDLGPLLAGAVGIALISLADTISTASSFAARTGQEIRGNQEMLGIGAANLAAGLFQGFPVSTSGSRTAVAERAGAKTQLTGVVGAALIVLMIVLVPGLLRNLPQPALAAVVITASLSLADVPGTVRLWRQRKVEFFLSVVAFLGVALLGVLPGIGIAVGAVHPQRLPAGLAAVRDRAGTGGRARGLPRRPLLPGGPAPPRAWSSTGSTRRCSSPTPGPSVTRSGTGRSEPKPRWIVIAAEPITDVDTTASDVLFELDHELDRHGIALVFAELKDPVRRKIDRYGLAHAIEPDTSSPPWRQRSPPTGAGPGPPGPRPESPVRRARRRPAPGGRGPTSGPVDPPRAADRRRALFPRTNGGQCSRTGGHSRVASSAR